MHRAPNEHIKWLPAMYAEYYSILKDIAHENGYALMIHGSLVNDLDLFAFPWRTDYTPAMTLLKVFSDVLGARSSQNGKPFAAYEVKLFNRVAFTIISGGGGYIDLSIFIPNLDEAEFSSLIEEAWD